MQTSNARCTDCVKDRSVPKQTRLIESTKSIWKECEQIYAGPVKSWPVAIWSRSSTQLKNQTCGANNGSGRRQNVACADLEEQREEAMRHGLGLQELLIALLISTAFFCGALACWALGF